MTPTLFISEQVATEFHQQITDTLEAAPRALEVLIYRPGTGYSAAQIASIEAAFYSRDIWQGTVNNRLSPVAKDFWSHLDGAPNLKWLQILAAGVDHEVYQPSIQRGIQITTSSGTNAEPVGLTAVTGLLMLARGFPHYIAAQQRRQWDPIPPARLPRDLRGQTALIVGTGNIGGVIARSLQAIGVRTVGLRRRAGPAEYFDQVLSLDALDSWLPQCDWLVLACPLNAATRGLIDARRLALLPRTAGFVNISRGEIVDEAALIDALVSGRLLGAYLDVFREEPLPAESPLWGLPNVLVTPHNSAASVGNYKRGVERFLRNLKAYMHEEPLEAVARRS